MKKYALALKISFLYLATEKVSLIMQLRVCIFLSCNSLAKTTKCEELFYDIQFHL